MSSICGIFRLDRCIVERCQLDLMIDALAIWNPDQIGKYVSREIGFGCLLLQNTPESKIEKLPYQNKHNALAITADARVDNREEICASLGISNLINTIGDSELIIRAYEKWENSCVAHLLGDFAFAIWDRKKRKLFCARDHMGCKPLFYFRSSKLFAFSSEIRGLLALSDVPRVVDDFWVAQFLTFPSKTGKHTFYKNIHRLPSAHTLEIGYDSCRAKKYWALDPHREIIFKSDIDYVNGFRQHLNEAIKCRLRSTHPVAAELSGGLDSSSIAAIAHDLLKHDGKSLFAFTHILPDPSIFPYGDEREQAREVCKWAGISNHILVSSKQSDSLAAISRIMGRENGPNLGYIALYSDHLLTKAQELGAKVMLSGAGGDQLVSSQANSIYNEFLNCNLWYQFIKELWLDKKRTWTSFFRQVILSILQANLPWIEQKIREANDNSHIDTSLFLISENLALKTNMPQKIRFSNPCWKFSTVREKACTDLGQNSTLKFRIEEDMVGAIPHSIEYRYPLLDVRLLEFTQALPSRCKRSGGFGRFLLRQAMNEILPKSIQWRNDKSGSTIPSVSFRLAETLRRLKTNDILDPILSPFVDLDKLQKCMVAYQESWSLENPMARRNLRLALMLKEQMKLKQLENNDPASKTPNEIQKATWKSPRLMELEVVTKTAGGPDPLSEDIFDGSS